MSKARDILEERLAKGEISSDEFEQLLKKLNLDINQSNTSKTTSPIQNEGWSFKTVAYWGLAALVIFAGVRLYNDVSSDQVHIRNLRSSGFFGKTVSGSLYTDGNNGYVYLWIEIGDNIMCPKKGFITSKQNLSFEFECNAMEIGRFKAVTSRTPSDWVQKNATSL